MKIPKGISSHESVLECEYGPSSGVEDYKWSIFLKEGYVFKYGRTAGCRSLHCNTVTEFLDCEPVTLGEYNED